VAESFASYVAEVAEVSMENGVPRVHRVVVAVDCGPIANPDIIAAQMEGSVVYGLTAALYGEIAIEGGRAVQANFDTYKMLRINEMPVVEVHIVPSTDSQGGVGEPGTPARRGIAGCCRDVERLSPDRESREIVGNYPATPQSIPFLTDLKDPVRFIPE